LNRSCRVSGCVFRLAVQVLRGTCCLLHLAFDLGFNIASDASKSFFDLAAEVLPCFKLATSPNWTGPVAVENTIGIPRLTAKLSKPRCPPAGLFTLRNSVRPTR
jgi:hypothetical protein